MKNNITLLYIIKALYYTWFWLGIWVLFYLKFGGFAAVGILEVVMIVSTIVFEIPTGAIGDLLGKRRTIILACIIAGVSQMWMGFSPNLLHAALSLVLLNFGGALKSGTFEAMIYDTLKEQGKEHKYMRVLSNMNAIKLATLAVVGVLGGFIYSYSNGLPFILNGALELCAAVVAFFLIEPRIDTEKFSLRVYLVQNIMGFKQLFRNRFFATQTFALLTVMIVALIAYEGLNDILNVNFGFNEVQLGIFASVLSLAGAGASYIAGKLSEKVNKFALYVGSIGLFAVSLLISPFVGLFVGGGTVLVRNLLAPLLDVYTSDVINKNTESRYRATTLSSFSMLTALPYALLIYPITASIDVFPARWVAFGLGVFTVFAGLLNLFVFKRFGREVQD